MPFFPYPEALLLSHQQTPHRQPLPAARHVEYDILNPFAHTSNTLDDTLTVKPYTGTPVAVVILPSNSSLDHIDLLTVSQELNLDNVVFAETVPPSVKPDSFRIRAFHKQTPVQQPDPALSIAACWSLLNRGRLCPTNSIVTQIPYDLTSKPNPDPDANPEAHDGSILLQTSNPFNPTDPIILVQSNLPPYTVTNPCMDLLSLRSSISTALPTLCASSVHTPTQTYLFVQLPLQADFDRLDLRPEQITDIAREFTTNHSTASSTEIQKLTVVFWIGLKTGSVGKKRDVLTTAMAFTQDGQPKDSSCCVSIALALAFAFSHTSLTPANGKTRYSSIERHRSPTGRETLVEGSIRLSQRLVTTISLGGRVGLTAQGWILCPWSEGNAR